jgi:N-acetylglucosamine-6-sulfatase
MDGSKKRVEGYVTDIIADKSIDWLKNRKDKDKPFLLMSQHKAPHRNWMPAERHLMMFDGIDLPEPETLFDDYSNRSEALKTQEMSIAKHFYWGWDMFFHEAPPKESGLLGGLPNTEYTRMTDAQKYAFDLVTARAKRNFSTTSLLENFPKKTSSAGNTNVTSKTTSARFKRSMKTSDAC